MKPAYIVMTWALLLLSLATGCATGRAGKVRVSTDPTKLRESVRQKLPKNATLEEARQLMTQSGFDCFVRTNGGFGDKIADGKFVEHFGVDYLYCRTERRTPYLLWVSRYIVALPYNENLVVTDVWIQIWDSPVP